MLLKLVDDFIQAEKREVDRSMIHSLEEHSEIPEFLRQRLKEM